MSPLCREAQWRPRTHPRAEPQARVPRKLPSGKTSVGEKPPRPFPGLRISMRLHITHGRKLSDADRNARSTRERIGRLFLTPKAPQLKLFWIPRGHQSMTTLCPPAVAKNSRDADHAQVRDTFVRRESWRYSRAVQRGAGQRQGVRLEMGVQKRTEGLRQACRSITRKTTSGIQWILANRASRAARPSLSESLLHQKES